MTDPMSAISLVTNTFSMALSAYTLFRKAVAFPDSVKKLEVELQVEHTRLRLWGKNFSGLIGGDRRAPPSSLKFEPSDRDVICGVLKNLSMLFQDTTKLREQFGLIQMPNDTPKDSAPLKTQGLSIPKLQSSTTKLRRRGSSVALPLDLTVPPAMPHPEQNIMISKTGKPVTCLKRRLQWAISSQSQFELLIKEIRKFMNSLEKLLRASQHQVTTTPGTLPRNSGSSRERHSGVAHCTHIHTLNVYQCTHATSPWHRTQMPSKPVAVTRAHDSGYEKSSKQPPVVPRSTTDSPSLPKHQSCKGGGSGERRATKSGVRAVGCPKLTRVQPKRSPPLAKSAPA
ncbi:prion-inhibition and propagation-domain-containing protein [Lentinula raphanica]|nr:prion-inhibition and propagation-domain-containing protein [Lentinula raphanica]